MIYRNAKNRAIPIQWAVLGGESTVWLSSPSTITNLGAVRREPKAKLLGKSLVRECSLGKLLKNNGYPQTFKEELC